MLVKSLISRVIILNILLLSTGIGILTAVQIYREETHLLGAARNNAALMLSTVEKAIFNAMRSGNSQDVQAILEMVGRTTELPVIRIFQPDGTILKSATPQEIGKRVSARELGLFSTGKRADVVRVAGRDVLAMVKPIESDPSCYLCHGEKEQILGVLNLNLSLADTVQQVEASTRFYTYSTLVLILLLSLGISIILLRMIKAPIHEMSEKMARVEEGDLTVRMESRSMDEMGSLMRSFSSMVVNLEVAQQELKQYHYQQMERADRLAAVGEMASGLAHEIKNPLAGISGAISVLADDFPEEDPRRQIVKEVLEQIGRLNKLATDLLYFGKPGVPEPRLVDVNALLKKTLFFVCQHPEAKAIHRVEELTKNLPPVWVDEKQIQQVFFNVILNAIQAMKDGGVLTIQTDFTREGDRELVQITVADTGCGIAESEREKIFAPFHTTKTQGTGLGLAICRQLLQAHLGDIRLQSRPGEGTTFTITLPAAHIGISNSDGVTRA